MNEALQNAFQRKTPDRIPWMPFVGVHGGYIIGTEAKPYLQSADALYEGVHEAIVRYSPDAIPVVFDLQIEAEILGCQMRWAKDCPPSVCSHPFLDDPDRARVVPSVDQGRIPAIMKALRRLKGNHPDVGLFGLITGPLTLATHLMGTDLLMKMILDPDTVEGLLAFCTDVACAMSEYYAGNGAHGIAVVDPMLSQIAPKTFQKFLPQPYQSIFSHIRSLGCLSASFVCGDARKNLDEIGKTHPDSLFVDENVPLAMLRDCAKKHNIAFGGNIPLASVLLSGSPELCKLAAAQCVYESEQVGFILAPGCDLLYQTPPENLVAIASLIHSVPYEQMGSLIAQLTTQLPKVEIPPYNPPDYAKQEGLTADIITLNSESCAACQYMVESVRSLMEEWPDLPLRYTEHRLSEPKTLSIMKTFGVRSVPSLLIDGQMLYESVVPTRSELLAVIDRMIREKKQ